MLNKYIKKRQDKNQSLNKSGGSLAPGLEEEKNSDKSKKSKNSGKSDQSTLSKKRNKK